MTDQEYLQTLATFEGKGDKKGIPTSSAYGITKNGINTIARSIRKKEGGDYTTEAKLVRAALDENLLKVLESKNKWDNKKHTLTQWADISDIEKLGDKAMKSFALAYRDLIKYNLDKLESPILRTEDFKDRIALAAYNRPVIIRGDQFAELYRTASDEKLRHSLMHNMDRVDEASKLGIQKRMASLFNMRYKDFTPIEIWNQLDKGGKEMISQNVAQEYQSELDAYKKNLNNQSIQQAVDSRLSSLPTEPGPKKMPNADLFIKDLTGKEQMPIAEPKQPQESSFISRLTSGIKSAYNSLIGANNQVAQSGENILNSNNGEV